MFLYEQRQRKLKNFLQKQITYNIFTVSNLQSLRKVGEVLTCTLPPISKPHPIPLPSFQKNHLKCHFFVKSKITYRKNLLIIKLLRWSLGFLILLYGTLSFDYNICFQKSLAYAILPDSPSANSTFTLVWNPFCQPWCNKTLFSLLLLHTVIVMPCCCPVIVL